MISPGIADRFSLYSSQRVSQIWLTFSGYTLQSLQLAIVIGVYFLCLAESWKSAWNGREWPSMWASPSGSFTFSITPGRITISPGICGNTWILRSSRVISQITTRSSGRWMRHGRTAPLEHYDKSSPVAGSIPPFHCFWLSDVSTLDKGQKYERSRELLQFWTLMVHCPILLVLSHVWLIDWLIAWLTGDFQIADTAGIIGTNKFPAAAN